MVREMVITHRTLILVETIVMLAVRDAVETVERVPEPARI